MISRPRPKPQPVWYVVVFVVVSMMMVAGAAMWWAERVADRQCAMHAAEVAVYREVPPATETGRRLAAAKEQFVRRYC